MPIDIEAPGDDEAALIAALQALKPAQSGVVLSKTSWGAVNYTTTTVLSWNTATEYVDDWWNISSPTIITIPAGVSRIDMDFHFYATDGPGLAQNWITFRKNGTQVAGPTFGGQHSLMQATGAVIGSRLSTIDVPTSPGDTWSIDFQTNDASVTLNANHCYWRILATEYASPLA